MCSLCQQCLPLKEETLHSWNTEMQRQTTFGMSLDRHLKPKGNFFPFKYLQKRKQKSSFSLSHSTAYAYTF